jgi:flagellar protein FlaG
MSITLNANSVLSDPARTRQELAAPGARLPPSGVTTPTAPAVNLPALPGSGTGEPEHANQAMRQAAERMFRDYMSEHDQSAEFSVDQTTGMTIVKIVNKSTGEMVRQIPTEEVIRIAQYFDSQSCCVDAQA